MAKKPWQIKGSAEAKAKMALIRPKKGTRSAVAKAPSKPRGPRKAPYQRRGPAPSQVKGSEAARRRMAEIRPLARGAPRQYSSRCRTEARIVANETIGELNRAGLIGKNSKIAKIIRQNLGRGNPWIGGGKKPKRSGAGRGLTRTVAPEGYMAVDTYINQNKGKRAPDAEEFTNVASSTKRFARAY